VNQKRNLVIGYRGQKANYIYDRIRFEKNKIRFPSKFSLEEEYIKSEGGRYKKSEMIVFYDDYKFFTVETEVKH
jgi:hypothetical protein